MAIGGIATVAGGDIPTSCFVKVSTAADDRVLVCGAGDRIFGVSQMGSRLAKTPYTNDALAAVAGENVHVYIVGEKAPVKLSGTVTRGDRLKAASGGTAVTAAAGDEYGGIAMQSGGSGAIIEMIVMPGSWYLAP